MAAHDQIPAITDGASSSPNHSDSLEIPIQMGGSLDQENFTPGIQDDRVLQSSSSWSPTQTSGSPSHTLEIANNGIMLSSQPSNIQPSSWDSSQDTEFIEPDWSSNIQPSGWDYPRREEEEVTEFNEPPFPYCSSNTQPTSWGSPRSDSALPSWPSNSWSSPYGEDGEIIGWGSPRSEPAIPTVGCGHGQQSEVAAGILLRKRNL